MIQWGGRVYASPNPGTPPDDNRCWDCGSECDGLGHCPSCDAEPESEPEEDDDCEGDETEGAWCSTCDGTGIGKGDPDTSSCMRCGGKGVIRTENYDDCDEDAMRARRH